MSKSSVAFQFMGGTLCVYRTGYGAENGGGYIAMSEEEIQWEAHEDDAGHTAWMPVPHSELIAIREATKRPAAGEAVKVTVEQLVDEGDMIVAKSRGTMDDLRYWVWRRLVKKAEWKAGSRKMVLTAVREFKNKLSWQRKIEADAMPEDELPAGTPIVPPGFMRR